MLEDIKKSYPEIYEKSKRAAAVLSEWVQKPVPEEEIGFLTIHFGAAQVRLEGKHENVRIVNVGIICASGIGISRLMLSKLDKIFRDRIHMETYGQNDLSPYIISKTDFFVSSIPMNGEETVFHVELEQVNLMVMQIKTILRYVEVYKVSNDIFLRLSWRQSRRKCHRTVTVR